MLVASPFAENVFADKVESHQHLVYLNADLAVCKEELGFCLISPFLLLATWCS
jgi:hypothetical protein